jgi:hypothetical protein
VSNGAGIRYDDDGPDDWLEPAAPVPPPDISRGLIGRLAWWFDGERVVISLWTSGRLFDAKVVRALRRRERRMAVEACP